jgi:hypothetical protein
MIGFETAVRDGGGASFRKEAPFPCTLPYFPDFHSSPPDGIRIGTTIPNRCFCRGCIMTGAYGPAGELVVELAEFVDEAQVANENLIEHTRAF